MDWQPIETAPKDGTRVLVWGEPSGHEGEDEHRVVSAWWGRLVAGQQEDENGEGWRFCSFDGGYYGEVYDATHWMPLPEPPEINAEKEPTEPERSDG
jgi:hypothetical protein